MGASTERTLIVEGDSRTMGEVISTTHNRLGWQVKFANATMRQISAVTEVARKRGRDMQASSFRI